MSRLLLLCAGACASLLLALASNAHAALIVAADNAANSAYNDGLQPGDNGGPGWGGGWTFRNQSNVVMTTTNGSRGWFTGSSLGNNQPSGSDSNGDGDINSPAVNRAWGVYSNATDQVYAIRPFNGSMSVGQTFKWDMDNGNINSGQVVGLRFLSNAADVNSRVFEARFVGGDSFYSLVGNPNQNTTHGFSREGLHLEYTLTTATTYSIKITRKENNATATFTGTNVNGNPIVAMAFKNQFAGNGGAFDGFLNNISLADPNIPPAVNDATINDVAAGDPTNNPVTHTFTATNGDGDPLTWSNFALDSYIPLYDGTGPAINPTFNPGNQQFSWNTTGSPRGVYKWKVDVSDGEATDTGFLTIHVTVPEPAALTMVGLALTGVVLMHRRRMI